MMACAVNRIVHRHGSTLLALTAREVEVLALVSDGLRSIEVAERLGITEATVKVHLSSCYRKLDVSNRVQAALLYRGHERGMTP
jgi:DNA-binding NarL/FixJ family response regulator